MRSRESFHCTHRQFLWLYTSPESDSDFFRNHDCSELVFLISLMIWLLDVQSEYYKYNVEFEDASIDVLDMEFGD